jgi:hypothetical protein
MNAPQCRHCDQQPATVWLGDPGNHEAFGGFLCDLHLGQRLQVLADTDLMPDVFRLEELTPGQIAALAGLQQ